MPSSDFQAAQSSQTAPQAPPIPPVPASPGAATGAPTVTLPRIQTGVDANANAEAIIRDAISTAENAAAQTGTTAPPAVYRQDPDIPPEVVPIIAIVFGSVVIMVIVAPIVRGIIKFIERRQDRNMVHGPSVANQLLQLQQSVDTLAIEVERISESQRFQTKLMAERDKISLPSGRGGA